MQPAPSYPLRAVYAAFEKLPWIFQLEPPNDSGAELNVHAHLSAFSSPDASYQPLPRGSVSASDSSCPDTFASASRPWLWSVAGSCGSQPGSPARSKKNANCTGTPLIEPQLCQAQ